MTDGPEIDLRDLRAALERVLDAVEARFGPRVALRADEYWSLDLRRSFDLSADQSGGVTVGQLSDDVQELCDLLRRSDDPVIWHDISHIVGVLRRLAVLDMPDAKAAG